MWERLGDIENILPEEESFSAKDKSEIELLLESLFGIQPSSIDGIWVASAPNSYRCKLGDSWKFWVRPYDSTCIDNSLNAAWDCKSDDYINMYGIFWYKYLCNAIFL